MEKNLLFYRDYNDFLENFEIFLKKYEKIVQNLKCNLTLKRNFD